MLSSSGGVGKIRRPADLAASMKENMEAFDAALEAHRNREAVEVPELSAESRALMQQILASNSSQDEISSRVAALLAGTALSTSRGEMKTSQYGDVEQVTYDIQNENLSSARRKRAGGEFEMPDIPSIQIPGVQTSDLDNYAIPGVPMRAGAAGGIGARGKRGSVKRQSELMREARKSRQEEREEERKRKESYYRKVAGLRKAKVPLMVYSCGGFSRCFRIARFYDPEGPPVGVVYERPDEERSSLNPDL